MYIPELVYPGTWVEDPDRDWAWQVQLPLEQLASIVADAALSLSLYEQAARRLLAPPDRKEEPDRGQEPLPDVIKKLEAKQVPPAKLPELLLEAQRTRKRKERHAGRLPQSYQHRLPFIHARSYLFTMDRLERLVGVLASMPRAPQQAKHGHESLRGLMPHLRGVRNSSAHLEDRSRGLDRMGRPLDLKPIDNHLIRAPGGVLALENLCNNRFGSTMDDGSYGEVDVSEASLRQVTEVVQEIIDAFPWTGMRRVEPT